MKLSRDAQFLTGQPMFRLMDKAKALEAEGKEILHFEIGDLIYPSPPEAIKAACDALVAGKTHYTSSMGILELRDAICEEVESELGFKPSIGQILIAPANAIIYFLVRCVVDRGDEVIVPDPGFPTYRAVCQFTGAKAIGVRLHESNGFRMSFNDVENAITGKTKLIIVNSPSNPTGAVMTEPEIDMIAQIAKERGLWLLSDEVYSKMIYEWEHYSPSVSDQCKERTIILNSFSKAYSMTGWRLGYAVGPEMVIEKMGLLLQTIISCLPRFVQVGGIAALSGGWGYNMMMMTELRGRKDKLIAGLNSLPGVSCQKPGGAFYAFPNITGTGYSSQEFADLMLEKAGVAVLPGTDFGEYGEGYVRLSYATGLEAIDKAIIKMKEVLNGMVRKKQIFVF